MKRLAWMLLLSMAAGGTGYPEDAYDAPQGIFLPVPGGLSGLGATSAAGVLAGGDPRWAAWNPAVPADRELPLFSTNVSVAFPTAAQRGVGGAFGVAAALPTAVGVSWFSADLAAADKTLSAWSVPPGFSAAAGVSRRVGDALSLGLGLAGAYSSDGNPATGLYGNIGALVDLPGLAPRGSTVGLSAIVPGPTPILLWESGLTGTERFACSLSAVAAAPHLADLAIGFGVSFALGPTVTVDLGYALESIQAGHEPALGPSLSVRLEASDFLRFGTYGASPTLAVRPVSAGVLHGGVSAVFSAGERDRTGPELAIAAAGRTVFSPLIADEAVFPFSMQDASRITGWALTVFDPDGAAVHSAGIKNAPSGKDDFWSRLFRVRRGISFPQALAVPLSADMPDGRYQLHLSAADEFGNESRHTETSFELDATPPSGTLAAAEYRVFSPNGDGVRDFLTIEQTGSREALWRGTIMDEKGAVVREFSWMDGPPGPTLRWDGRDAAGDVVADGVYAYVLSATDAAGNRFSTRSDGIRVDAAHRTVALTLDAAAISPDAASMHSALKVTIKPSRTKGLQSWTITLTGGESGIRRVWQGSAENLDLLPDQLWFDGRTSSGDPLPDGTYRFHAVLRYGNGDQPTALSDAFVVDSQVPQGRVRVAPETLRLDRNQQVVLYHDLSPGAGWRGAVRDAAGKSVRILPLENHGEPVSRWNGNDDDGRAVPPGWYTYQAEGTSAAGLTGTTEPVRIRVETGGYGVSLIAESEVFSTTAVGGTQRQRFYPRVNQPAGAAGPRVASYVLEVRSAEGSTLRRYGGLAPVPAVIAWDGRDETGYPAADGVYTAQVSVAFENGDTQRSGPVSTALDSTPPELSVTAGASLFSPNGDQRQDRMEFTIAADQDQAARWSGELLDDRGLALRRFSWVQAPPGALVWDGTDGAGSLLPDGRYRLRIAVRDAAGNSRDSISEPVVLDARQPTVAVDVDKKAFSPNGDAFADALTVELVPSFSEGLAFWRAAVVDAAGRRVRLLGSRGAETAVVGEAAVPPPAKLTWDGLNDARQPSPDGDYRLRVELRYAKGDLASAESRTVTVDSTPPQVALDLKPLPFSPDGDGIDDALSIAVSAEDPSPLAGWMLTIVDPAGYPFTVFSGATVPAAPFAWNGVNLDGQLVEAAQDYDYTLRVRDVLGNTGLVRGAIPTDVFVLRDGDRLKIRVSSIVFPPSSAALTGMDGLTDQRNEAILDRIAGVLKKYPSYKISVQGHAVNLSGTDREERTELEPLSLKRAQSVLDALARRGVEPGRMEARGLGGREPLVPHGDAAGRWRNRRVEFILMR